MHSTKQEQETGAAIQGLTGYSMEENRKLVNILEFILREASPGELEAIEMAIKRRRETRKQGIKGYADLDFHEMAKSVTDGFGKRFGLADDVHQVTRRIVKDLILQKVPQIKPEELEVLLDQWAPGAEKKEKAARQSAIPREALMEMIDQFIAYGLGKMSPEKKQELDREIPGWYNKYWDRFPPEVRALISSLLKGEMGLKGFGEKLNKII